MKKKVLSILLALTMMLSICAIPAFADGNVCEKCHGTGHCEKCGGDGELVCSACNGTPYPMCTVCYGDGQVRKSGVGWVTCTNCAGIGYYCPACKNTCTQECSVCTDGKCPACGGTGKAEAPSHTHGTGTDAVTFEEEIKTSDDLQELFENGGKGYLANDIITTKTLTVEENGTIDLCLNGHVIKYQSETKGSVITILTGATLNLCDCGTTEHAGYVDADGLWHLGSSVPDGCTAKTVKGGIITGGTGGACVGYSSSNDGGGVRVDNGTFIMSGGTICGNVCDEFGGGVFLTELSTAHNIFTMTGGEIFGNVAGKDGAGCYGGGVFASKYSEVTLGGTAVVRGNHTKGNSAIAESNIHLQDSKTTILKVSTVTPLTDGADIGVTIYASSNWAPGTEAGSYLGGTMTDSNYKYFVINNSGNANKGTVYRLTKAGSAYVLAGTFSVTVNSPEHGKVQTDKGTYSDGETVTVTVTPNEGYQLKTLKYNDGEDHEIEKDTTSGKYQFTMPGYAVTVTAEFEEIPHAHSFTYAANDGKITAACTEGCDKGYDKTPLTLTLTAPESLVYDGNTKAFTFADGEAAAWTGAGLELPTIYYHIKQSGQTEYMPLLGTLKAVGNYMAKITVGGKDAQIEFTIDKATPYIKTNPAPTDITYGKKLADSTLAGGYVQVSSTNSTEIAGLFEWTNPDTVPGINDSEVTLYDVTFTPVDGNNYNTVSCQVTITVNHTHNLVKVDGQAAAHEASGYKDYYECKDSADACHKYFEDENGNTPIDDLTVWKANGGSGYIAPLPYTIGDILATVEDFPTTAENGWGNENGAKMYADINQGLMFKVAQGSNTYALFTSTVEKSGNNYVFNSIYMNLTFVMSDNVLENVIVSGVTWLNDVNGTYAPHVHNWSEWDCDGTYHWKNCTNADCPITNNSEKDSYGTHSFVNYVYDENAKCGQNGTKTAKCEYCTATDTVEAPGTAAAHLYVNFTSNGDAACTADGTMSAYCAYGCGQKTTVTEKGSALGHNYVSAVVAPTASAQGYTLHTCSRCGDSYKDNYTDPAPVVVTVLPGDFDGNGEVNGKDLIVLRNALAGAEDPAIDLTAFDMNGDGKINGKDLSLLRRYLAG